MKTIMFQRCSEFASAYKRAEGIPVIRTIILGIALILCTAKVLQAQDEFPKQTGLHAQQGIDLIP